MSRVTHFIQLTRTGLPTSRCWQMSGLQFYAKKAANFVAFILCIACITYLLSAEANAQQKENSMGQQVTLSPISLMKAIAVGQVSHIEERLHKNATISMELQKQLDEITMQIAIDVNERNRLRTIIEATRC